MATRSSLYATFLAIAVCPIVADATTLAVIGDYGNGWIDAAAVAEMVGGDAWGTDYVLALGDHNYGSAAVGSPNWEGSVGMFYGEFLQRRSGPTASPYPYQTGAEQRFFPVVGNHDILFDGTRAGYLDYFHADPDNPAGRLPAGVHSADESYYAVELPIAGGSGSIGIFALDSESFVDDPASRLAQTSWLKSALQNSPATWKFVTMHRPVYSSGLHGSEPLLQLPYQEWGAHAVLSAHDHDYERLSVTDAVQDQMPYFVNGLGGSTLRNMLAPLPQTEARFNAAFGAMRIEVTDQTATFEFLSVDESQPQGIVRDAFTLDRSALPVPPGWSADFSRNGSVGAEDLSLWRTGFGVAATGDANLDARTTGFDFLFWQRQSSAQTNPAAASVAEPASWTGAIAALVILASFARASKMGRRFV